MSGSLANENIVVVGAGTRRIDDPDAPVGIGRAISIRAAEAGASVVCVDKDAEAAELTAKMVREKGGQAGAVVADVSSEESCAGLVDELDAAPITGLVLNVGIALGKGIAGTTVGQWDVTMGVNLRSNFLLLQHLLPRLNDGASIVFIASAAGLRPGSWQPAYDASKAGVVGLARHTALECSRRGIRANVIAPGLIDTSMGRDLSAKKPGRDKMRVPLGRQGTAWEVAASCVFLLSADAGYITGQVLAVDGGLSLI